MKFKVQIVVESESGETQFIQEVAQIEKGQLQPENLGLTLAQAKELLQKTQRTIAAQQIAEYQKQQKFCSHCSQKLLHKEQRTEEAGILFEGCQRDWEQLPRPDLPLVVGMDGGYVRFYNRKTQTAGHFQVIAGKSIKADGTSKRFGMVYCYDTKPQRRVFEVLRNLKLTSLLTGSIFPIMANATGMESGFPALS